MVFSFSLSAFIPSLHGAVVPVICSGASWNTTGVTVAGSSTGSSGSTLALLSGPQDFDVDTNQTVYVADTTNQRVMQWTSGASSGTVVAGQTSTSGSTASLLSNPISVKYANGSVYVADFNNYRVQKWVIGASSGTTVAAGNGNGGALNQMGPTAFMDVDAATNVYLSDYGNSRITKWAVSASTGTLLAGNNGAGTGLNQLNAQWGIFFDSTTSYLYIADRVNYRVLRWLSGAATGTVVAGVTGTSGNTATLLNNPGAVLLDSAGYMYVLDGSNYRVLRFIVGNTTGTTILSLSTGTAANQLSGSTFPYLMRFDTTGNLYLGDYGNNRIQRYNIICPITTTTTTTSTSTTTSSTSSSTSTSTSTRTTTTITTTTINSTISVSTTAGNSVNTTANPSGDNSLIKIIAPIAAVAGAAVVGASIFLAIKYIKTKSAHVEPQSNHSVNKLSPNQAKPRRPPDYKSRIKNPVELSQYKNLSQNIRIKINTIP